MSKPGERSEKRRQFEACAEAAAGVQDVEGFKQWIRHSVRTVLPHGPFACVYGRLHGVGVTLDYVITVDYPMEHLMSLRNASGQLDTPIARQWWHKQEPVFFDENHPLDDMSENWLANFHKYGLVNAAANGVQDQSTCLSTYFSFHQLPRFDIKELRATFATLTPLLHEAFVKAVRDYRQRNVPSADQFSVLTAREQEIADLISQGKSNGEIAVLLGSSENTIKNHLARVFDKTGCSNRVGLAAAIKQKEENRFGMTTKIL